MKIELPCKTEDEKKFWDWYEFMTSFNHEALMELEKTFSQRELLERYLDGELTIVNESIYGCPTGPTA